MATQQEIRQRIDQVRGRYAARFAGQPRVTRNPAELEEMLTALSSVSGDVSASDELSGFSEEVGELTKTYTDELQLIRDVKAKGPGEAEASRYNQLVTFVLRRYQRNFAGRSRHDRDLGILQELVDDLGRFIAEMDVALATSPRTDLQETRESARRNKELYEREFQAIRAARLTASPDGQAALQAQLANAQFSRYRALFAGKSRLAVRRQSLEVIVRSLTEIRDEMKRLQKASTAFEPMAKNIQIVETNITAYSRELEQIAQVRRTSTWNDRVSALAEAANACFQRYRDGFVGQSRSTRDLAELDAIWESLWPIMREMNDMMVQDPGGPTSANLQKVLDALRLYEREWGFIRDVQQPAPQGGQ